MHLHWVTCGAERVWCPLETVNLSNVSVTGVYIIWVPNGRIVRVGIGDIRDRLQSHRSDPEITRHGGSQTPLLVTWAASSDLSWADLQGIERYLGNCLSPVEGKRFLDVVPIKVNLPWPEWS